MVRLFITTMSLGLFVVLAAGCDDRGCALQEQLCLDHYTVRVCTSLPTTEITCPTHCRDLSQPTVGGCDFEDLQNPCACAPLETGLTLPCIEDARQCDAAGEGLLICRDSSGFEFAGGFWERLDCDRECQGRGAQFGQCVERAELEGGAECFCAITDL